MTEFEVVIRVANWTEGQRLGWFLLKFLPLTDPPIRHADIEVRKVEDNMEEGEAKPSCPFCHRKLWCVNCDPFGTRTHGSQPFPLEEPPAEEPEKEHDPTINFILAFEAKMIARYEEHMTEKGSSWIGIKKGFLYDKLDEEYCEVFQTDTEDPDALMDELVDLGVVAAMCHARELYTKQGRGK